jgi:hypothetical protein
MKKNDLLWGLLIMIGIIFLLRIIGPLFKLAFNIFIFLIIAAAIYSFINPTFRARVLSLLRYIKTQIFK